MVIMLPIESSCLMGNWMPENSVAKPAGPDEVEEEFMETLRQAAFIFEREKDGRFHGSIVACKAVARFIHRRGGGAELAGPFLQIAAAFEDLARGGKPRLFLKKSTPEKERERSPERKHVHVLAAAALEVMVRLTPRGASAWDEDTTKRANAADRIARYVNEWPGMGVQHATGLTVIAWRNQQRKLSKDARKPFDLIVERIMGEPDPRKAVDQLLRSGPPGLFKN
jgi:hypothetical protein